MIRGSPDADLRSYNLTREVNNYHYTNQGSTDHLAEKNDYKVTTGALKSLGFTTDELQTVWKITAAILHLGNITFKDDEDNVLIDNKTSLSHTAKLLNVTQEQLTNALTHRTIAAYGDIMKKGHNIGQAEHGRDALAKAIYDRLFTWIIRRINKAILVPGTEVQKRFDKVIGVLDIYGFEIFDTNSFEQFCINYCNEKLQQLFIGE